MKGKMELDYKELELKCGLEIHQQLDTKKLFCRCPSEIREEEPDIEVKRKMRAVPGEMGEVDPAALHEFLKDRELIYEAYSDSNCLVELDEEPPHGINENAVDVALTVSVLLNAKIFPELQVMRKTVIDGSNTSGFQRTLLVAEEGSVETKEGKVGIPTICLEEDAARKIREENREVTYRLDRLGIPLVEIATDPEIKTPSQAKEVAKKIGKILRCTKVKRGLGTIRQDLNISILGGERTEIKGVQNLGLIPKVVKLEAKRQVMLEEVKEELEEREGGPEDLQENFVELTEILEGTQSKVLHSAFKEDKEVWGVRLKNFQGLLEDKLGPELAHYAQVSGVKGIFHSDELPGYGISKEEVENIGEKLKLGEKDAFALVAEEERIAKEALRQVVKRSKLAFRGVIDESRRVKSDGSTEFMRPLPGSARMYPETDHPPIEITSQRLKEIKENLPQLPEEKIEELVERGLGKELASQMIKTGWGEKFEEFNGKFDIKPSVIATTLISIPKEVKKRYDVEVGDLREEAYEEILKLIDKGKITKEVIPELLAELGKNPDKEVEGIVEKEGLGVLSQEEAQNLVEEVIQENYERAQKMEGEKKVNFLLGRCMAKVKGKYSPQKMREMIKEILSK